MTDKIAEDKKQILGHINSIFKAFLAQDRETLRRTHAENWVGFMVSSVQIERGLEAYMANAEYSFQNYQGTGYELLDSEIQLYGDLALVYYVARYDFKDAEGTSHSLPLRSIDVYRREADSWIQAGSHITIIPSSGN